MVHIMFVKQVCKTFVIITSTIFSSAVLAGSSSILWSGRVQFYNPINVSTDGQNVTYEVYNKKRVRSLNSSSQYELKDASKMVKMLTLKL